MASTLIIGLKTLKITCRNTEYQALLLDNSLVTGIYDNHVTAFLITSMFTFVLLWGPLLVSNRIFWFIPMKWHLQSVMFPIFITATPSFSNSYPDYWLPCSNDMQIYLSKNIVLRLGPNCIFYSSSCKLKLYCLSCHIPVFSTVLPALFSFLNR